MNYIYVAHFSQALFKANSQYPKTALSESIVCNLLELATSHRERELIQYFVVKLSVLTPTGIRRHFGLKDVCEGNM